jgi:Ca2+/Na+ antiporter
MTVFGMAPALWILLFVMGYALYFFFRYINKQQPSEELEGDHQEDTPKYSALSWLVRFLGSTIALLGLISLIYLFSQFRPF